MWCSNVEKVRWQDNGSIASFYGEVHGKEAADDWANLGAEGQKKQYRDMESGERLFG